MILARLQHGSSPADFSFCVTVIWHPATCNYDLALITNVNDTTAEADLHSIIQLSPILTIYNVDITSASLSKNMTIYLHQVE